MNPRGAPAAPPRGGPEAAPEDRAAGLGSSARQTPQQQIAHRPELILDARTGLGRGVAGSPITKASPAVGNGSTEAASSSARLHHSSPESTLAIRVNREWWFTQTTPM